MPRPFRFAVQASSARDAAAWRAKARLCEELGYSTLFVPDHLGEQWGPLVAMTVAAEATTTLRVGCLVFDNDLRHPVVLAKEVATLDLVSGGRVEFGLGAGWLRSDHHQAGIPFERPGRRVERMVEALEVMTRLWRDGSASFDGRHYSVAGAQGRPRPVSDRGPAVIIGGGGRKVLTAAARHADIVGVNPGLEAGRVGSATARSATSDRFRQRVAWVREAAGDRMAELELQLLTFAVVFTDDAAGSMAAMAPMFGLSASEAAEVPVVLAGTTGQMVETLGRRREEYGFSYVVVHDHEMEPFAEVVAQLAGT